MLLAARQAWRAGAPVFLVGHHAPLEQVRDLSMEAVQLDYLEEVPLAIFDRPVVICGTQRNSAETIRTLERAEAKIACLLSGSDAGGAALLSGDHDALSLEEVIADGVVQCIITVEADVPDALLSGLEVVAACDWLPTEAVRRAELFLPTTAWVEMDGTYINYEGRAQRFRRVLQPGTPIAACLDSRSDYGGKEEAQAYETIRRGADDDANTGISVNTGRQGIDPDLHPPRIHRSVPPGSDPLPAWELLAALAERLGGDTVTEPLTGYWEKLRTLDPEGEGVRVYD